MSKLDLTELLAAADAAAATPTVRLLRADAIELRPVRWLWNGFLPAGMLTLLGGAPGCGKTTLALSLAATITTGGTWPDGSVCGHPGDVMIWSGEDANEVVAARLVASGADMTRMHFISGSTGSDFDPSRDIPHLEKRAAELAAPRLLLLDPIVSAVSGDGHKSNDVRRALQPVVDLAHRLGCAVLGITHFSKGTGGRDPAERITGSIAFAALARVVLVAAKAQADSDSPDASPRLLLRAKSNIGPDDGGFKYELERVELEPGLEGQCVRWGDPVDGSARELLAVADQEPLACDATGIEEFVRQCLADGPVPTNVFRAEAEGAGYAWHTTTRVARRLGAKSEKAGMKKGWFWSLPRLAEDDKSAEGDSFKKLCSSSPSDAAVSSSCSVPVTTGGERPTQPSPSALANASKPRPTQPTTTPPA